MGKVWRQRKEKRNGYDNQSTDKYFSCTFWCIELYGWCSRMRFHQWFAQNESIVWHRFWLRQSKTAAATLNWSGRERVFFFAWLYQAWFHELNDHIYSIIDSNWRTSTQTLQAIFRRCFFLWLVVVAHMTEYGLLYLQSYIDPISTSSCLVYKIFVFLFLFSAVC